MRILLVEDHRDTRHLLTLLLRRRGHAVEAVGTVAAARALLEAGLRPDAAVVNRVLPGGDGRELGPDLAALGVPAVAFSGLAYPADAADSLAAGFAVHLAKPADLDELLAAVAAAVAAAGPPPCG